MQSKNDITVGENLKNIRKEFNLKQHEITGGEMTRNLISLIENNKTPLYKHNALIIAENINSILRSKNIDTCIDAEDIIYPERYKAKKTADIYIKKLQTYIENNDLSITEEEIANIENFLMKWPILDKKIIIYELLGDLSFLLKNRHLEYTYYTKALQSYFNYPIRKDIYKLILKLAYNRMQSDKYNEAITLYKSALLNSDNIPERYISILHFNIALAYKSLNQYDRSLRELEISKKHIDSLNMQELKSLLILEANCFREKGFFNNALKNYSQVLKILDSSTNHEEHCMIYINIMETYKIQNDKGNILQYIDKVLSLLPTLDYSSGYTANIYYEMAKIFQYLDNYESSEEFFIKALEISKQNREIKIYFKIILSLFNFYYSTNNLNKILSLDPEFNEIIPSISLDDSVVLSLKLALAHIDNSNTEIAKKILINTLNKGGVPIEN